MADDFLSQLLASMNDQSITPESMQDQGSTGAGLNSLFNTPNYALMYGQENAQNQANAATAGTYDPTTAFRQDPGYQFSISEGMKAMQQHAAAKGLLESGGMQKELQNYAQGTADQNYQRFLTQQQGLFGNYQSQLAGLSQFGAGQTGGQQSVDMNSMLAQLLAQGNFGTGQNIASGNLSTGSDIASLFANQGVLNANAYLNTGAAQANNLFRGNEFTAQLMAQQQARSDNQQNSLFSGAGAQSGYNGGAGSSQQLNPGFGGGSNGYSFQPGGPTFTGSYF